MAIVYLGFGSNLGDRRKNIETAIRLLEADGIQFLKLSSLLETAPSGGPPQNLYLNAVAKASTQILPRKLLQLAKNIEKRMGRVKTVANGPREIDIDILLFEGRRSRTDELTVPHPRMRDRLFVMLPLAEIEDEDYRRIFHENFQIQPFPS